MKVKNGSPRPSMPFPSIFNKMSGLLQKNLLDQNVQAIIPELPSGVFVKEEGYLKSMPLPSGVSYVNGRFDLLVKFDDGTYGVIDAKMTDQKDEDLQKFDRQLHAYIYALENPAKDEPVSISKIGLLVFEPSAMLLKDGKMYYQAVPKWKEIARDDGKFLAFISEVETLLAGDCPPPNSSCGFCTYRSSGHRDGVSPVSA